MEETKPISKIVIEIGGDEYVFAGGGGGGLTPGVPIPADTVDTNAIIDGAVEMQDLNDEVKQKIQKTYDEDDETLHMDFDLSDVNSSQTQEAGAGEDEVSGDGPSLDDLGDLPGGGFDDPMLEEEGD